jgi:hypothetical protein
MIDHVTVDGRRIELCFEFDDRENWARAYARVNGVPTVVTMRGEVRVHMKQEGAT